MSNGPFPGVKRPGCGVDHPPHLAPRLKKEYGYTSTPPLGLRGLFWGELYLYFTFILKRQVELIGGPNWLRIDSVLAVSNVKFVLKQEDALLRVMS
jgi:hypothetical protein